MLIKELSLPKENVIRQKPCNLDDKDEVLFLKEYSKELPAVSPDIKKNSLVLNCGKLFNGIFINSLQFNIDLSIKGLIKSYLKSIFFLIKSRKIKRLDKILYVTNSNSKNFFHWSLDVLQKLQFLEQKKNKILNLNLKIIVPNNHINDFFKITLEAFNLDFYYQKKNEIIFANQSILLPDLAPTGNFRKELIIKLGQKMRNYLTNNQKINFHTKRVYISRKNAQRRRLKNEDEIIPILKKYGFIIVDFDILSFEEQLNYILDCEILVGVHGSGLSHMLWLKQKCKVLEIRAKNNSHDNCFFTLASDLGHDYFYVTADKADLKKSNHLSDLIINKNSFSEQLLNVIKTEKS